MRDCHVKETSCNGVQCPASGDSGANMLIGEVYDTRMCRLAAELGASIGHMGYVLGISLVSKQSCDA